MEAKETRSGTMPEGGKWYEPTTSEVACLSCGMIFDERDLEGVDRCPHCGAGA